MFDLVSVFCVISAGLNPLYFNLDWSGSILKNKIMRAVACGSVVLASFAYGSDLQGENLFKHPKVSFTSSEFFSALDNKIQVEDTWPENQQNYKAIKKEYKEFLDSPKEFWDDCVETTAQYFAGSAAKTAKQSAIEICRENTDFYFQCFNEATLDNAVSCVEEVIIEGWENTAGH